MVIAIGVINHVQATAIDTYPYYNGSNKDATVAIYYSNPQTNTILGRYQDLFAQNSTFTFEFWIKPHDFECTYPGDTGKFHYIYYQGAKTSSGGFDRALNQDGSEFSLICYPSTVYSDRYSFDLFITAPGDAAVYRIYIPKTEFDDENNWIHFVIERDGENKQLCILAHANSGYEAQNCSPIFQGNGNIDTVMEDIGFGGRVTPGVFAPNEAITGLSEYANSHLRVYQNMPILIS